MVIWLLRGGTRQVAAELATALADASQQITLCPRCGFFATENLLCEICSSDHREASLLCVVENPTDILPLERTGAFKGHYHVLGGRISPLDNIGPADLRIGLLMERIAAGGVREIILAVGSDVEGEATAHFLMDLLRDRNVQISRIAQGLPAGSGLESADELTLYRALHGRRTVG